MTMEFYEIDCVHLEEPAKTFFSPTFKILVVQQKKNFQNYSKIQIFNNKAFFVMS